MKTTDDYVKELVETVSYQNSDGTAFHEFVEVKEDDDEED